MGVAVTFSYANWDALFPKFSYLTQDQIINLILPLAEQYCPNDGSGPSPNAATQTNLLNLMVAHVAQLLFPNAASNDPAAVGRVASATEGSVSVALEMPSNPNAAWFNQTQYGAMYWAATAFARTATYRAPCPNSPVLGIPSFRRY